MITKPLIPPVAEYAGQAYASLDEIEVEFGDQVKALRLRRNLTQKALATKAGVSISSLQNLETGKGCSLRTVIAVVRALDRIQWLLQIAPAVTVSPLAQLAAKPRRQRASQPRKPAND